MTAAGLDFVSDGRCILGLGASGPQVVEGFHGVPYEKPLMRIKETIEVVRRVVRREVIDFHGQTIDIPLPEGEGTGLGKPLKLINRPGAPRDPDLVGVAHGQRGRRHRRGGRRLAADHVHPRAGRRACGATT